MTTKPTVAEFFAQYAEKGHIFPKNYLLCVKMRNNETDYVGVIFPEYSFQHAPIFNTDGTNQWRIDGKSPYTNQYNIIAILDDAGNVIAGEVV